MDRSTWSLFPGVFYHLRHILMSFDNIWKVLKPQGTVLVETHVCDNHFVLADGRVTTLKAIDRRLLDVPLFRFYRTNELNPADWSNWFGGNVAAMLDIMRSAGFTATHLSSWQSRGAFRGIKNPAVPREWERGSYEGTSFKSNDDGTWTAIWHDPRDGPTGFARRRSAWLVPVLVRHDARRRPAMGHRLAGRQGAQHASPRRDRWTRLQFAGGRSAPVRQRAHERMSPDCA